jgi:6-phosphogluconolactonase
MATEIRIEKDLAAISASAAEIVIQSANQAISQRGRFSLSLSGGSTPRSLYSLLAQSNYLNRIEWEKVDFFWGDERCVPPDHPDSDFGMARKTLLDHLPQNDLPGVYRPKIYRMEGELEPEDAAQRYEKLLRSYFPPEVGTSFDLLLLGMGEDGHTASLFPHTPPIFELDRWAISHYVSKLSAFRLTLTPPILNRSRTILFLASGAQKASVLAKVLYGERNPDELPSQVIQPVDGNLIWLIDQVAAAELPGR